MIVNILDMRDKFDYVLVVQFFMDFKLFLEDLSVEAFGLFVEDFHGI